MRRALVAACLLACLAVSSVGDEGAQSAAAAEGVIASDHHVGMDALGEGFWRKSRKKGGSASAKAAAQATKATKAARSAARSAVNAAAVGGKSKKKADEAAGISMKTWKCPPTYSRVQDKSKMTTEKHGCVIRKLFCVCKDLLTSPRAARKPKTKCNRVLTWEPSSNAPSDKKKWIMHKGRPKKGGRFWTYASAGCPAAHEAELNNPAWHNARAAILKGEADKYEKQRSALIAQYNPNDKENRGGNDELGDGASIGGRGGRQSGGSSASTGLAKRCSTSAGYSQLHKLHATELCMELLRSDKLQSTGAESTAKVTISGGNIYMDVTRAIGTRMPTSVPEDVTHGLTPGVTTVAYGGTKKYPYLEIGQRKNDTSGLIYAHSGVHTITTKGPVPPKEEEEESLSLGEKTLERNQELGEPVKSEAGEAHFEPDDHHAMGESSLVAGGKGRRGGNGARSVSSSHSATTGKSPSSDDRLTIEAVYNKKITMDKAFVNFPSQNGGNRMGNSESLEDFD